MFQVIASHIIAPSSINLKTPFSWPHRPLVCSCHVQLLYHFSTKNIRYKTNSHTQHTQAHTHKQKYNNIFQCAWERWACTVHLNLDSPYPNEPKEGNQTPFQYFYLFLPVCVPSEANAWKQLVCISLWCPGWPFMNWLSVKESLSSFIAERVGGR